MNSKVRKHDIAGAADLGEGGIVNIKLGRETYRIGVRHRYRYSSTLNPTNSHRNFILHFGHCDVVAFGHWHDPLCETRYLQGGKKEVFLRNGTYKTHDRHSKKHGFIEGKPENPIVILFPDRHKVLGFEDMRDGIIFLESVRKLRVAR